MENYWKKTGILIYWTIVGVEGCTSSGDAMTSL